MPSNENIPCCDIQSTIDEETMTLSGRPRRAVVAELDVIVDVGDAEEGARQIRLVRGPEERAVAGRLRRHDRARRLDVEEAGLAR